ncbi:hypothetical protein [Streptomyces sp. NBC_01233]|nr:hypothetical protein OG332_43555 [Streptomyces sp. NBC_01233]
MLTVSGPVLAEDDVLGHWITRVLAFADTLPPREVPAHRSRIALKE